jgi:hypothetical protein
MTKYPSLVCKLISICDAWIIGSSCIKENPRDYDIFIPINSWKIACKLIPETAKINRLGGFKCISEEKEIDIWTGEFSDIFLTHFFTYAYNPKINIKVGKIYV